MFFTKKEKKNFIEGLKDIYDQGIRQAQNCGQISVVVHRSASDKLAVNSPILLDMD